MFIVYNTVIVLIFLVSVAIALERISKLRNTTAAGNSGLLPFAYYSLGAWILWAIQYVCLLTSSFNVSSTGFLVKSGLCLGIIQNALWATSIFSLYSSRYSRISVTLPFLIAFSIILVIVGYRTTVLTSVEFALIDGVFGAIIFGAVWVWILQRHLGRIFATGFLIHGLTQVIWRSLWLIPLAKLQLPIVLGFSLWRIALLGAWVQLISAIVQRTQPPNQNGVRDFETLELANPYRYNRSDGQLDK